MFLSEEETDGGNFPFSFPLLRQRFAEKDMVLKTGTFPKIIAVRTIPRYIKKINIKSFERGAGRELF